MKEFIKEYFKQDNCGTAYPIYFVIRDVVWVAGHHYCDADRYIAVYDTDIIAEASSETELAQELINDPNNDFLPKDFDVNFPDWDSVSEIVNEYASFAVFGEKKEWKNIGMFLLKREAEKHLRVNYYHYTKEAHVYCEHAWRAPDTEKFLNNLKEMNINK